MSYVKSLKRDIYESVLSRKPFYKKFRNRLPLKVVNSRCAISKVHKYIYFRVPKAANSTVISSLYMAAGGNELVDMKRVSEIKKYGYLTPSDLSIGEQENMDNYFKFTIVRDPYARLLSGYQDKIVRSKPPKKYVVDYFGVEFESKISLEDFITYLENGGIYDDAHWARQSDLVILPVSMLNFIGRVENLENDVKLITENIFGKSVFSNADFNSTRSSVNPPILSESLRERIHKLYYSDFFQFGYSM